MPVPMSKTVSPGFTVSSRYWTHIHVVSWKPLPKARPGSMERTSSPSAGRAGSHAGAAQKWREIFLGWKCSCQAKSQSLSSAFFSTTFQSPKSTPRLSRAPIFSRIVSTRPSCASGKYAVMRMRPLWSGCSSSMTDPLLPHSKTRRATKSVAVGETSKSTSFHCIVHSPFIFPDLLLTYSKSPSWTSWYLSCRSSRLWRHRRPVVQPALAPPPTFRRQHRQIPAGVPSVWH